MLAKLKEIEPIQAIGLILLGLLMCFASMDWRLVIPFGLLTILTIIVTLYKILTSWTWAKVFLKLIVVGVCGIAFFVTWGSVVLILFILAAVFFVSIPD